MRKRRAKSFGTYLLYGGVCSREVLECATRNTAVYGGRLGTSLVELGALGIDEVGHHLAAFLGVPEVPGAWIEAPARDALSAVSRDLAEKLRVLPLRLEGRLLHVAMRNPCSASERDELGRSTGFGIQPYAVADLRLSALLEHYYGIPGELRVAEEASEESGSRPESESAAMDREGEELVDEETFAQLHTDWQRASLGKGAESEESFEPTPPIAVSAPAEEVDSEPGEAPVAPAGRADAAALEAELLNAPDRDAVARLALRLARIHVDAAALFVVRGRIVSGFRGDGEAIPEGIDGIMVPVDLESALTRVAALGEACRARPEAAMDQRILRALGREGVREVLVHPIRVRHHLVNLLYADAGSESLAETSVVALGVLCELVSRAYARLILERKKKHLA
jgi:hypothetical protein